MSFVVSDYLRDTRCLSLAARGAWMDILCALWVSEPRGDKTLPLTGWAGEIGKSTEEAERVLNELQVNRIADISERDGFIQIVNRRMVRERTVPTKEAVSSELSLSIDGCVSVAWVLAQWQKISGVKPVNVVTESLRAKITRAIGSHNARSWWASLFITVEQSDFLCGRTKEPFHTTLDWVLGPKNLDKVLSGNYTNGPSARLLSGECKAFLKTPYSKYSKLCGKPARGVLCDDCIDAMHTTSDIDSHQ